DPFTTWDVRALLLELHNAPGERTLDRSLGGPSAGSTARQNCRFGTQALEKSAARHAETCRPQVGTQLAHQSHRIERLRYHTHWTEGFELADLALLHPGRHEDDRDIDRLRAGPQMLERFRPIHHRHHDIAENHVGGPIRRRRERFRTRSTTENGKCRVETQ